MNPPNSNGVHRTSSGVAIAPYPTVISSHENVPLESNSNHAHVSNEVEEHGAVHMEQHERAEYDTWRVEGITSNVQQEVVRELNSGGNTGQASVANSDHWRTPTITFHGAQPVRNPDGTPLLDHNHNPIPVAKMLATKPLRSEIQSRKGHGNSKVAYLSTDCVSRTLNDIFGFDGWTSEVLEVRRTLMEQTPKGQWLVMYDAKVRCTHKASGSFKEDIGVADSIHGQIQCAISNAIKAAVSDGLKRAARHFGDKLGNVLYSEKFRASNAPLTLKDALNQYDIERANSKFGFEKDRNQNASNTPTDSGNVTSHSETTYRSAEKRPSSSVTHSTVPTNQIPAQQTNVNPSSNSKIQSSRAQTTTSNRSGNPSSVNSGQRPIPQNSNVPSSSKLMPTVSVSVSSSGGNTHSVSASTNSGISNGVPRFQRQVNQPNQTAHGYSSSHTSQISGASIDRASTMSGPPPPPFANRTRSDVLNDITGTMNTSSSTGSHTNATLSSMTGSTNLPSNQDNNPINPNQANVYSKRKLELSNESTSSIGAQKKMNANPYSKN